MDTSDYSSSFIQTVSSPTNISDSWLLPIAKGGTSVCYKLFRDGRLFFKKQLDDNLKTDQRYRSTFLKEFNIGSQLDCPFIVKYLELIDDDQECSILTDYVNGVNLKQRMDYDAGYFSDSRNLEKFLTQLVEGLKYLHERQIIHMDINPQNIMIASKSNNIQIVDLGFCYSDNYQDTVGTTEIYSASEALDGQQDYDVRTDIYAIGKVLEFINEKVPLPKRFARIMKRCLMENKEDRYQNVEDIIQSLDSHTRKRAIIASLISLACLAMLFFYLDVPRHLHRIIYGYEFNIGQIGFNIVSEKDKTCEVVKHCPDLNHPDVGNVSIDNEVSYRGEWYKVVKIDNEVFLFDTIINVLTIHAKDVEIGRRTFCRAKNLRFVELNDSISNIHEGAFSENSQLKHFRLPSQIKVIPRSMLAGALIKNIVIPEGATTIEQDAFAVCDSLVDVSLPLTLQSLERGAFWHCYSLEEITLPENVKKIGMFCFDECPKLKRVYNKAKHPQRVVSIFDSRSKLTIYVPRESVEEYKKAECWRDHTILPMP